MSKLVSMYLPMRSRYAWDAVEKTRFRGVSVRVARNRTIGEIEEKFKETINKPTTDTHPAPA